MSYIIRVIIELGIIIFCILAIIHDYNPPSSNKSKQTIFKVLYELPTR